MLNLIKCISNSQDRVYEFCFHVKTNTDGKKNILFNYLFFSIMNNDMCYFPGCSFAKIDKCKKHEKCTFHLGYNDYCEMHSPIIQFHYLFPHVYLTKKIRTLLQKLTCYEGIIGKLFLIPCSPHTYASNICEAIIYIILNGRYDKDQTNQNYVYDKLAQIIQEARFLFIDLRHAGQRIFFINNAIRCLMNMSAEIASKLIKCWMLLCTHKTNWPLIYWLCRITWKDADSLSNIIQPIFMLDDLNTRGSVIYIYFGLKDNDRNITCIY